MYLTEKRAYLRGAVCINTGINYAACQEFDLLASEYGPSIRANILPTVKMMFCESDGLPRDDSLPLTEEMTNPRTTITVSIFS